MSRRALARRIAATVGRFNVSTRRVWIVAKLLVHDRRPIIDGTLCPCCGSPDAEVCQPPIDIANFVVVKGKRRTAADMSPAEWEALCASAERHDVTLRCSVATLPMIMDESPRARLAAGGNRAQKTTSGLTFTAVQYLRRGGRQRRFWICATTEEKAFDCLEKLFRPTPTETGIVPPILPSVLVLSSPGKTRSADMKTRMIDGSIFEIKAFAGDPKAARAKSHPIFCALIDEAADLPGRAWLTALRGRCVEFRGVLWYASTATPNCLLQTEVNAIQAFENLPDEDPVKISRKHPGAGWLMKHLPMTSNPWVSLEYIEESLRTLDLSIPENQRDFLGLFRPNEGLYWEKRFDPTRHTFAHEHRDFKKWTPTFCEQVGAGGHADITGRVRRRICRYSNPHHATITSTNDLWLVGQDQNIRMESVLCQVTAPMGKEDDPEHWHLWVQHCETSKRSTSDAHAEKLVSVDLSKVLTPGESTRSLDGALVIIDPTSLGANDPHGKYHGKPGSVVDTFARYNLEVRGASYRFSENDRCYKWQRVELEAVFTLLTRLLSTNRLHVATRCNALLDAFENQLAHPSRPIPLDGRSGKADERMGPVDALKYLAYAIFNSEAATTSIKW